jgi:hypothetical protein
LAKKALGQAHLASWKPGRAHAALTEALEALPEDPELHYARALAAITVDYEHDDETEKAWNGSFTARRVAAAFRDLVVAVNGSDDPEMAQALRWLVDRAGVIIGDVLMAFADEPTVAAAAPEIELVSTIIEGAMLGSHGQWRRAADMLTAVRARLVEAGLPVLVAYTDLQIADCSLRLYEIQRALDRLDAAERGFVALGRPLDPGTQERFDQITDDADDSGQDAMVVDYDHMQLFSMVFSELRNAMTHLRSQALQRTGDLKRSVAEIDNVGGVADVMEDLSRGSISPAAALGTAAILRDAERDDEAMQLADRLAVVAESDEVIQLGVHNLSPLPIATSSMMFQPRPLALTG